MVEPPPPDAVLPPELELPLPPPDEDDPPLLDALLEAARGGCTHDSFASTILNESLVEVL
ncbi:hypothetical protein [Streptomyces sp. NPDC048462]|uniref:hypothetical protein n=1 Tax=Streptomyces sp. NPDC048462 TaxID=3365555 RepID=UPI003723984C